MNYFELFGLPLGPAVDRSLLATRFFLLQKENHPDFFTQGTESEKETSLEQSADINKACNIFQHEEKTIEYFLQLIGLIEPREKYNLPPEFLMEMMEINEALTEADKETVAKQVEEYNITLSEAIKPVIEQYDPVNTKHEELLKLKEYYYKKKYLKRILDRLPD